jgi:tRNA (guanine-N(7)-)-methyltransferase
MNEENLKGIKTYARTIGKKLKPSQKWALENILPKYKTDATKLNQLVAGYEEAVLEIGFGMGDHLAFQAGSNPEKYYVGIEPYLNGVAKLLKAAEENGLTNLSIYDSDITAVIDKFPEAFFSVIYILFPDPWPKKKHKKRRLLQPEFLAKLTKILKLDGEIKIATDIRDYADSILASLEQFSRLEIKKAASAEAFEEYSPTKYHKKAISEGREAYFISARKIQ